MAISSGFFNSKNGDRRYNAALIGRYLQHIVSDGVFAHTSSSLQVLANDGMEVQVQAGRAMMDCHYMENDAPITLTLNAGGSQDRIDGIIMYVDMTERACGIVIKEGTPAAAPTPPALTRTDVRKEYMLAAVRVTKLSSAITQSNITDTRADKTVCGWVTGVIDQVDTTALFAQWKAAYDEAVAEMDASLADYQRIFEEWYAGLAENLADGTGLPIPTPVDAGKVPTVNAAGTGYELKDGVATDKTLSIPGAAADAATVGQALTVHNLLNNSDFTDPVNSNGADQYDLGGIETIDRWKKRNTGVLTIVPNEGLQITSVGEFGGLFQTIDNGIKRLAGKTVTLAAYVLQSPGAYEMMLGNSNNDVTAGTAYGEKTFAEPGLVVSSVTLPESFDNGDYLNFYIGEGDAGAAPGSVLKIAWCALYEGGYTAETLPVYCPRGYSIEAAICGGGGSLNFKVVGGTAQPTNPSENTIWVNTDVAISSYVFATAEPSNPKEGMVWIATDKSSDMAFNALKKNAVMVYPLSAKQYVSGKWVDKTAKTYQSGEWIDWIDPDLLYRYGNENTAVTGGWKTGTPTTYGSGYNKTGNLTVTNDENGYVAKQTVNEGNSFLYVSNLIDLTKYSTLYFHGSINNSANTAHYCRLIIYSDFGNATDGNILAQISANNTMGTRTIDVSGINRTCRIAFFIFSNTSSVTMREMWLE